MSRRLDVADFPRRVTINAELQDEFGWRGWVRTEDGQIPLDQVKSIYYRRPTSFIFPDDVVGSDLTLAAVDGAAGLPEHAPYDRIIATCAVSRVPWSWAEQTSQGGLILVDLKVYACLGNLVLLRREHDRLEGHFDAETRTPMGEPPATELRVASTPSGCGAVRR